MGETTIQIASRTCYVSVNNAYIAIDVGYIQKVGETSTQDNSYAIPTCIYGMK